MISVMTPSDPAIGPLVLPVPLDAGAEATGDLERTALRLFDEYRRPLLRYVMSLGLAQPDAEDVVQDVFVALFRHLRCGGSRSHLTAWLFQVAHNLGIRYRRRSQRRWWLLRAAMPSASDPVDPGQDPEARMADIEQQRRWQRVIQAMPERDRQCVLLRAEGHTYRGIATALNVSLGAVAKSMARALARLARVEER